VAIGPSLARPKLRRAPDDGALVQIILDGIRGTEMPGRGVMTDREAQQTAAFVRTLGRVPSKAVPGNRGERAARLFRRQGRCVAGQCHGRTGRISAPDLAGVRRRGAARTHLLESLHKPRRVPFPDGYLLVSLTPKNGPRRHRRARE
jgi:hypothetical protein